MTATLSESHARWKEQLLELVIAECRRRLGMRNELVPAPGDGPDVMGEKAARMMLMLRLWALDPVKYIQDCGWAPDPKGDFGGRGKIPAGLTPPGMVPILLFPEQKALIEDLNRIVNHDGVLDLNLLKSRQVAATALMDLFYEHGWRFRPGFTAIMGSYSKDRIDPGGKGHRQGDSLFSRFRAAVDAFMWQFPHLPFNTHIGRQFRGKYADPDNPSWLGSSDDASGKIQRPRWFFPSGEELFPGAYKNYVAGALPGDKFGKGDIFTLAWMDEFGEYDVIGPQADRKARETIRFNCNHIVTTGTIPEGGGAGSEFKRLCDLGGSNRTLINRVLHWSDIGTYMLGAWFICRDCERESDYGRPLPGPGPHGIEKACEHCGTTQTVYRPKDRPKADEIASPAYIEKCESLHWDTVAIARYMNCDWRASAGDRFFYSFVAARALPAHTAVPGRVIDGFDPGTSAENPAAWMAVHWDHVRMVPRVVGYWMAPDTDIEWWVPFLKRWEPADLARHRVQFGRHAGRRFIELGYDDTALDMLRFVSQRIGPHLRFGPSRPVEADKYGNHRHMMDPPYYLLQRWGVEINAPYTKDRVALVQKGRDWAARLEIEREIAMIHPGTMARRLPSVLEVFDAAKSKPQSGQSAPRLDVDKTDPPFVNNACDAWFYACRSLPDISEVRVRAQVGGEFELVAEQEAEVVVWGEGAE